jgi:uncharacterized protein
MKNSLNKSDYDELETCLSRFKSDRAMNLEEVDGFFTALICSPEITPPSVYLNEIWGGGEMPDDEIFNTSEELQRFINLIMSHWNIVVKKLSEDEVFCLFCWRSLGGPLKAMIGQKDLLEARN